LSLGHRPVAEAPDGLPLPPPDLRVRVAGTADIAWFLEGGRLGEETIRGALDRAGNLARGYVNRAKACLEELPDTEYRRALRAVPDFILEREN